MGGCLYTALFPMCAFGDMAAMAPPGAFPGSGSCIGACILMDFLPGLLNCMAHTGIRNAYGIQGDCCGDCVAGCLCIHCSICQQNREVQIRRAAGNAGGAGMVTMAPAQLVMAPQVQYAPQPQVQYVQAPPQVQYVQAPPPQVVYAQQPQVMYAQPQQVVYR